jgi:AbrB family looped-hinge helix DNA binding protein
MDTFSTVVSSKGQIVIPAALREELNIEPGTRISIQREQNHLVLQPITRSFIKSVRGCGKGMDLLAARERAHQDDRY